MDTSPAASVADDDIMPTPAAANADAEELKTCRDGLEELKQALRESETALAERGWAIFRETGVDSAESFGELRATLFGEMEMQSYKTGVVRA